MKATLILKQKTKRKRNIQEKITDFNERVQLATHEAYLDALASGQQVIIKKNDQLIQVNPDGSEKILKSIPRLKSKFKDSIIHIG